jgi:putative hydrolase of the HAD superfamily
LKDYKPSLTIYQKVLEQAGIKAEESVFLDDGPKNIEAAEQVGIHGLLVPKNEDWMPNLMALLNEENS